MDVQKEQLYDDEIDLANLFKVLWKRKTLIIAGTSLITVAAVLISFMLPKIYKSEGTYQYPSRGLLPPEYKRYLSVLSENKNFINFLQSKKTFDEQMLKTMEKKFNEPMDILKWIKPIYAYSKEDVKEIGQIPKDEANFISGVKIYNENTSPENARKIVAGLGDFTHQCIVYGKLYDYIYHNATLSSNLEKTYENLIIVNRFDLRQLAKKRDQLLAVKNKYPESVKGDERQVVSLESGGQRYLSPVAQLVGVESNIIDLKEKLTLNEREKEKNATKFLYFKRAKDIIENSSIVDSQLFEKLIALRNEVFNEISVKNDAVQEVSNSIVIDFDNFNKMFYEDMRFVSGPSLPEKHIKSKKSIIVAISFFAALFGFVMYAFILEWFHNNRSKMVSQ